MEGWSALSFNYYFLKFSLGVGRLQGWREDGEELENEQDWGA